MNPDWTLVGLAIVALLVLYSGQVRCALSPGGHPGALLPRRGLAWRCSRCSAWVDPAGLA